jgi:hypothetical protein
MFGGEAYAKEVITVGIPQGPRQFEFEKAWQSLARQISRTDFQANIQIVILPDRRQLSAALRSGQIDLGMLPEEPLELLQKPKGFSEESLPWARGWLLALSSAISLEKIGLVVAVESIAVHFSEPPDLAEERLERDSRFTETIARTLGLLLADQTVRDLLLQERRGSQRKDQSINLNRFVTQVEPLVLGDLQEEDLQGESHKVFRELKRTVSRVSPSFQLFFPVKEHRRQWQGGPEILVAFDNGQPEKEIKEVVAFDIQGERISLDPEMPPMPPVVVLSPCAPIGSFSPECDPLPPCPPNPPAEDFPCINLPPSQPPPPLPSNQVILTQFRTTDVEEFRIRGDPEIFLKVWTSSMGLLPRTDLGEVTEEDTTYAVNRTLWVCNLATAIPDGGIFIFFEDDWFIPDFVGGPSGLITCGTLPTAAPGEEFTVIDSARPATFRLRRTP